MVAKDAQAGDHESKLTNNQHVFGDIDGANNNNVINWH